MKIFLIFIFPVLTFASEFRVKSTDYDPSLYPEYLAIESLLKTMGPFASRTLTEPVVQPMSQGKRIVEEAKARNRAILAQQKNAPVEEPQGDDPMAWAKQTKRVQEGWKKEVRDQRLAWQKEQRAFLLNLKTYKENTFVMPVVETVISEKPTPENLPNIHIINGGFSIPVRDQKSRPTCSAFAGVRAMELLLQQNGRELDLSEQYFYWASKPKCQQSPCEEKGSWISTGLKYSQDQKSVDIPLENLCAYQTTSQTKNETQVPLPSECHRGMVKIKSYEEIMTLSDVLEKLKADVPVIMAAKLTDSFYVNKGLVNLGDASKVSLKDEHALGHAFVAVGFMELPVSLKAQEGDYCIVVTNSWGKGWGSGGYSCLTQNWLTKFRTKAPFVAVSAIEAN
jgi:Papain family cysteine protease